MLGQQSFLIALYKCQKLVRSASPLLGDDAELGQVAAKGVAGLRALTNQEIARPVQHQNALLLLTLDRDKAHSGASHRFPTGFSVDRIVLSTLDVRLHVSRRHQ